MKKIAIILIIALALISFSATAEPEVTLPAGLAFDMKLDKATAVSGYTKTSASGIVLAQIEEMGLDSVYLSGKATIGGHDADVKCFFVGSVLKRIEYNLTTSFKDESSATKECRKIAEQLTSKYGKHAGNAGSKHQFSPAKSYNYKDKNTEMHHFNFIDKGYVHR